MLPVFSVNALSVKYEFPIKTNKQKLLLQLLILHADLQVQKNYLIFHGLNHTDFSIKPTHAE